MQGNSISRLFNSMIPFGGLIGACAGAGMAVWFLYCWGGILLAIPGLVIGPIIGGFIGAIFAPVVILFAALILGRLLLKLVFCIF